MVFWPPKNMRFDVYAGFPVKPLKMSLTYKLLTSLEENV